MPHGHAGEEASGREGFRSVERAIDDAYSDPLDVVDLDQIFVGFADGSTPLRWGAAIPLAPPGPPAEAMPGVDWVLSFRQELEEIPGLRDPASAEIVPIRIEPPSALVSVTTSQVTCTGARDVGRPLLRALLGLLESRYKFLRGAQAAWEGPIRPLPNGNALFGTGRVRIELRMDDLALEKMRNSLASLSLANLTDAQTMALRWVFEAWRAPSNVVRFVDYWFVVVALADAGTTRTQRDRVQQMTRVKNYLNQLPIGTLVRAEILGDLRAAYRIRNGIVHEGRQTVAASDLRSLVERVHELLAYELGRTPR